LEYTKRIVYLQSEVQSMADGKSHKLSDVDSSSTFASKA